MSAPPAESHQPREKEEGSSIVSTPTGSISKKMFRNMTQKSAYSTSHLVSPPPLLEPSLIHTLIGDATPTHENSVGLYSDLSKAPKYVSPIFDGEVFFIGTKGVKIRYRWVLSSSQLIEIEVMENKYVLRKVWGRDELVLKDCFASVFELFVNGTPQLYFSSNKGEWMKLLPFK